MADLLQQEEGTLSDAFHCPAGSAARAACPAGVTGSWPAGAHPPRPRRAPSGSWQCGSAAPLPGEAPAARAGLRWRGGQGVGLDALPGTGRPSPPAESAAPRSLELLLLIISHAPSAPHASRGAPLEAQQGSNAHHPHLPRDKVRPREVTRLA